MSIEQIINGLSIGSIYALIALGYSMVYGIVKLINFAHGDVIMIGSFMVFFFFDSKGLPVAVTMLLTIAITTISGLLVYKLAYDRLLKQGSPKISLLITAIGMSIFIQNLFQTIFSPNGESLSSMIPKQKISIGSISIYNNVILNLVVSILLMIGLIFVVKKTRVGKAMRAASEDSDAAKLMGVNSNFVVGFTFAIGSAIAGVGSILYSNSINYVDPFLGNSLGIKAFVAAVLGGIGSIPGAMAGGYLLGLAENLTNSLGYTEWSESVVFVILILILLFKPTGLFGKPLKEKV